MKNEQVNHPAHYNSRKDGLECIDVIRHYTFDIGCAIKYLWRAGLKGSAGMTDREKETEDLRKAAWYIDDYRRQIRPAMATLMSGYNDFERQMVYRVTGVTIGQIVEPYRPAVAEAMSCLLRVGIIYEGQVYTSCHHEHYLDHAIRCIDSLTPGSLTPNPSPKGEGRRMKNRAERFCRDAQ